MKLACGLFALVMVPLLAFQTAGASCSASDRKVRYLETEGNRPVRMVLDTSTRYELNTTVGAEEWAHLMPSGGHLIHLQDGDTTQTYTSALFHQLRCLDILREDYVSRRESPLRKHCLNYIRQSVLCIADNHLEYSKAGLAVTHYIETVCNDWTTVYAAAEKNYAEWQARNNM
ncbi:hypothetical protein PsYK624_079250 [Phanerochaete sordida]|uniref:Uncharacterized protein n=1 Tax=Phanerochaete sordida TaxID=48140 RepID=A0A9P3GDF7_9APHY|nr:hypothetical protein PsYK624_079250 [Phanerochaete sordida]